jgi:hypothetical protein
LNRAHHSRKSAHTTISIARETTARGSDASIRRRLSVRTIDNMNEHLSQEPDQSLPPPKPRTRTIGWLMLLISFTAIYVFSSRPHARTIYTFATVIGIILVTPWLVVPIGIKRRQWSSQHPRIEAIDPLTVQDPHDFAESARELELAMADLGFRHLADFRVTQQVPGVEALASLFANESEKQTARWITSMVRVGPPRKSTAMLAFVTDFTDGTKLVTANNVLPSPFPRVRVRESSLSYPTARGPRRLYEIHRACLAHFCGDAIRRLPPIKDPAAYFLESIREEQAKHVEAGYHYLDEKRDLNLLTWKGAYVMTWKLMWPIKPIRAMIRQWRGTRLLKELGLREQGVPDRKVVDANSWDE